MDKILLAIGSGSMWGMSAVLEKNYLVDKFTPLQIIAYRSILIIIVWSIFYMNQSTINHVSNLTKNDIMYFVISMFFGLGGIYWFFTLMKKSGSTMTVSMVQPLIVVFATLFGVLIFGDKLKRYDLLGILFVIIGILLLNWDKVSKFLI
jgi:drug/metabolite transporter (DMT)-like permease